MTNMWITRGHHTILIFEQGNILENWYGVPGFSFNRRHKRHGQLFQNRYKSIICQEDRYLKELVRYIHLNPLRAKVVSSISELATYAYCGHSVLMSNIKREWQDAGHILSFFGSRVAEAQKGYRAYVEAGIEQGRRPELVGGGVIRSVGGWTEVKKIRLMGQDRLKGDERILGESDFVMEVLSQADEMQSRHYELKQLGYDLERVQQRVAEIYGIDEGELYRKGRQKARVEARSLLFFWAVRELGISGTSLAQRFGMSQPGIGYSVNKGAKIAREKNYRLLE